MGEDKVQEYIKNKMIAILENEISKRTKYESKIDIENKVDKIINDCKKEKINILTILDENYPECLKNIYNPPKIIYYIGNIKLLNNINYQKSVGVIGSREATQNSSYIASKITNKLMKKDYIIVSGLACGIDGVAHKEIVNNNKKTIAVLGSSIDESSFYPKVNLKLKEEIVKNNGLIISEYPPYTKGTRYTFPQRNRIIAGLISKLIVIQAKIKSGSIITCNLALEQGKDVYTVVQEFDSKNDDGNYLLVRDGAIPILSILDIDYYF